MINYASEESALTESASQTSAPSGDGQPAIPVKALNNVYFYPDSPLDNFQTKTAINKLVIKIRHLLFVTFMRRYIIELFCREDSSCPLLIWLESFNDENIRARISARIIRLENGNFGDWKSIGLGLKELRFQFGSGYRVYYFIIDESNILILCAGDKKSQRKDISTAYKYLMEYKNANHKV